MNARRWVSGILISAIILVIIGAVAGALVSRDKSAATAVKTGGAKQSVPWDYRIEQKQVGDLLNGDMTLLPDNVLMPNDNNYATGDTVWLLSAMDAVITTGTGGKSDVKLSSWTPLKTFKEKEAAAADQAKLKEEVQADVDLVGVYKTELNGRFREFAVISLPSGMTVKQPIDEAHYQDFKTKKQVKANLEIVHDFANYDQAFAKFRGWTL